MRALKVISGPAAGQSLDVEADVVIGREGADLSIPDEEISRRHAVVRPVERGVVVEDLGSTNGTFVNGEEVSEPVTLTLGSTLRVGNSEIAVELDLSAPTKVREIVPAGEPTVAREIPPAQPPEPEPVVAPPPEPATTKPPPGGPRGPAPAPRYGGSSDSDASRPKPALIAGAVAAVAALAVVLVLVLGGGDDEDDAAESRDLSANLTLAQLSAKGKKETLTGEQSGPPAGTGTVEVKLTFAKPPEQIREKTKLSGTIASRFDTGSYNSTFEGSLTPKPDGTGTVTGDGKVESGTGDFEGAQGTFKLDGEFNIISQGATLAMTGSVEY